MGNKRETLNKNQIIALTGLDSGKTVRFQIKDAEIKVGSSCLVYRALRLEDNRPVILKELFPKGLANATRKPDGAICWPDKEPGSKTGKDGKSKTDRKTEESRRRFSDSVDIMKEISKQPRYKHYIGADYNIEVLSGNNTLYCINEDFGDTYMWSEVNDESLLDVMECSLAIAMFLNYLHQKGYVYIDLKPENILLPENGMQQVDYSNPKFIDFDSVLKSGVEYPVSSVHGTPGYIPDYLPNFISEEICAFTNESYIGPARNVTAEPKFDVYSLARIMEKKIRKDHYEEIPGDLKSRIEKLCNSMKRENDGPSMEEVIGKLKFFIKALKEQERILEGNRFVEHEKRYKKGYPLVMSATIIAFLVMTMVCIALGIQYKWVLSQNFSRSRATVYLGATLCVILILIIFTIKYVSFRLAIQQEFSRIANQAYDAGMCNESNYFEYGYDLTAGKKKENGGFYRPYLWIILGILLVAVFIVSLGVSSIPIFLALGFASIIAFMYVDYIPKDNYTFSCAARRTYSGKFYSGVDIKGNERALFFLDEYDGCNNTDIFDLDNPFYKQNHLNIHTLFDGEEKNYSENLDIQSIRNIYIMAWETLINTKRIVDLVLLFITLLAVFLDIAATSAFFSGYFRIPEILFLPLTLATLIVNGLANILVVYFDRAYAEEVVYFLFASRYFKENVLRKQFEKDIRSGRILPIYIARGIRLYNEEIYVDGKYPPINGYSLAERNRFFSNRILLHHLEEQERLRITIDIWLGFGILLSVFVWHMRIYVLLPVLLLIAALLNHYMYHKGVSDILRKRMIRKIKKLKSKYPNKFYN